ncbi:GDP-mannose 4,6-dehydratase [Paenibacillus thailandensis]|uniref:GDP-mannose 4,6-dehydratase n=1 Tax=Paenibacillus thailandensis TaxID=393250 RepID=A0ABW5QXQ4_9BACL
MKAFITGIAGFAGSFLAEHLLAYGMEVSGTVRNTSKEDHIRHLLPYIRLHACDLRDKAAVNNAIREAKPDYIFHLAAQSDVPSSWQHSIETLYNNFACQTHLLEAVRTYRADCKILIAGSSEQYGYVKPDELPVKETNPFRPLNPYAISKITQEHIGYQYYKSYGLQIVTVRAFHHTGPRRGENFVTSSFAKQIAEIESGLKAPVLYVGNLEAKRDFLDVRDVARAYRLALECCDSGEAYNVASGRSMSIREVLGILLSLTDSDIDIQVEASRLRPADSAEVSGDYSKLHSKTGWKPEIAIEQTMADLLNYWRAKITS